jgi:hypothetical protein
MICALFQNTYFKVLNLDNKGNCKFGKKTIVYSCLKKLPLCYIT